MFYAFGDFVLDVGRFELRRAGRAIALQPKVFDVLRYLVENRDRVVEKDELLDRLWPGVTVNESAVAWSVSHARRALGQRRGDLLPIETVQKRGYRFRGTVTVEHANDSPRFDAKPAANTREGETTEPFVGRAPVLERLIAALDCTSGGAGAVFLLEGDAGIGKTRCASELARIARGRGISVWVARCLEADNAPMLWPIVVILREAAAIAEASSAEAAALIAELQLERSEAFAAGTSRSDAFFWIDRAARHLLSAARAVPRVVIVDDLQRADTLTLRTLAHLAPDVETSRLLLVATVRDLGVGQRELVTDALRTIRRHAHKIHLEELTEVDVQAYVRAITGQAGASEMCRQIWTKTGGNPLLVRETVGWLSDRFGNDWAEQQRPVEISVPDASREIIRARIRALPKAAQEVLRMASVLGTTFELSVLERALGLGVEPLLAALEDSVAGRVLVERAGIGLYAFVHELVRETMYRDLPRVERCELHGRAALALEQSAPASRDLAQLAHHFYRSLPAGDRDKAARYSELAARHALRGYAHEDAVRYLDWALDASSYLTETKPEITAELYLLSARACAAAGRRDDARRRLTSAIDIAREHRLGSVLVRAGKRLRPSFGWRTAPDPLAREALELALDILPPSEMALRASALGELAGLPPYSLTPERSRALSDQAVELARGVGGRCLVDALRSRLFSLDGPDHVAALVDTATEILALEAGEGVTWVSTDALYARLGARLLEGDLAAAERDLSEFGRIGRELHLAEATWHHDRIAAQLSFWRGELDSAEAQWIALARNSDRLGLRYGEILLPTHLATLAQERTGASPLSQAGDAFERLWDWVKDQPRHRSTIARWLFEAGRTEDARRELAAISDPSLQSIPRDYQWLWTLANVTVVAVGLGDGSRAQALYAALGPYEDWNAPNSFWFTMGSVAHYLGLIAESFGDPNRAIQHLERALERNTEMRLTVHVAKTELELARLLSADPGKRERSRSLLAHVLATASALQLKPLVVRAAALRATLD